MNSPKPTHTQNSHTNSDQTKNDRTSALLGVYQELSKSHQAIDDFRMKLLGLLPLASLTGIFFVSKSDSFFGSSASAALDLGANKLIAFISIFAATFTLALFLYEIRGILMCSELIYRGCKIENNLEVIGQFSVRRDGHKKWPFFNAVSAACFIYSVVFAAWLFLALHRGFGFNIQNCTFTALASGTTMALVMALLINKLVENIHKAETAMSPIGSAVEGNAQFTAPSLQTTSFRAAAE